MLKCETLFTMMGLFTMKVNTITILRRALGLWKFMMLCVVCVCVCVCVCGLCSVRLCVCVACVQIYVR